jgi:hypothetical protein
MVDDGSTDGSRLGLLGEYLGRVYEEVKRRPLYVVDQIVRGAGHDPARLEPRPATETRR